MIFGLKLTLIVRRRRTDPRTRQNRIVLRNEGFKRQFEGIVDAYMSWSNAIGEGGLDSPPPSVEPELLQGTYKIRVMDVFGKNIHVYYPLFISHKILFLATFSSDAELAAGDQGIPAALVRQGLVPCAPFSPTLAISTRLLELYRNSHLRCPHLAIQPFVKGLCDLHGIPFRSYLSQQFSICYDLYLSIREDVQRHVGVALQRDSPNWRLSHACPACTYKLEGEADLIFKMLVTMDGNDSLKRILRRQPLETPAEGEPEPEGPQVGVSRELPDHRTVAGDYLLSREKVDRWAKDILKEVLPTDSVSFLLLT
jgi:hypothetical protein